MISVSIWVCVGAGRADLRAARSHLTPANAPTGMFFISNCATGPLGLTFHLLTRAIVTKDASSILRL